MDNKLTSRRETSAIDRVPSRTIELNIVVSARHCVETSVL